MALTADSGGIYGLYDADERRHPAIRAALRAEQDPVIIPMPVLSEIDYLLRKKLGIRAELDFVDDIRAGAFTLEPCLPDDLTRCASQIETYRDLDLGLAGACVVATAERIGTLRILTVDERHFRLIRTASGKPLTLLPADA